MFPYFDRALYGFLTVFSASVTKTHPTQAKNSGALSTFSFLSDTTPSPKKIGDYIWYTQGGGLNNKGELGVALCTFEGTK